ncbi:response regulator transcription factor [Fictibacillus enclensis]|uniref:response regulator transcription factor n=1 Tax=Fictibacillus enclensis TaxID=1017270 RepID=UPI0024BFD4BB|nr:response regulator transcription factor [Fictibacillus enclensis]WHY72038.1 helix-turn-helix domain-containing protein [Fictibacillus enclensis]
MSELLIVDNDKQCRKEVCAIIQESKYSFLSIYESSTAHRGMLLLKQSKPSALMIDISLPDTDGIAFGKIALQLYPDLPIIVMTQLKMFELVQSSINAGFLGYLLKPLSKNELIETLDRVLIPVLSKSINQVMKSNEEPFTADLKNPIGSAIQYMQIYYSEPLTLKGVADKVYLSPSYFSKMFKEETGMTFVEYLSFVRVQKAKSLLRMSTLPIEVIANNAGFANSGYFATTFKKLTGITPSDYREQFHLEAEQGLTISSGGV